MYKMYDFFKEYKENNKRFALLAQDSRRIECFIRVFLWI